VIEVPALADLESTPAGERYLDRVLAREAIAELASLRPVLAPRSLVVIGAGRRPESVGAMVLRNLQAGGYPGAVFVVNPHAEVISGVRCLASVEELPADVDLPVLCVPAAAVPEVAERCGQHGVRALLVVSSGVSSDPALAAALVEVLGCYGMRLVGPNCLGLVNTDPDARLQATFAAACRPGQVGIATQSGGSR
jgi:acyl-CoA synthetase (NDP forming)